MSGAADVTLPVADARALLAALDLAFEQILLGRCRAAVAAARVLPDGLGPEQRLRNGSGSLDLLLLVYSVDEDDAAGLSRVPGCLIGRIELNSEGKAVDAAASVDTELMEMHDPNTPDGNPLAGGLDLEPCNEFGQRAVVVIRSGEQRDVLRRAGADRARGHMPPPMGKHRMRATLGLGAGSHRPALSTTTIRPMAGLLLGRLGGLIGASVTEGARIRQVTLALVDG